MENALSSSVDEGRKRKLAGFLADLLRFGCLRGFKYLAVSMRGKEEMVREAIGVVVIYGIVINDRQRRPW